MGEQPELTKRTSKTDVLRIIECPVCHEVPFPPIYQCITGHNICKLCKPKLQKCPICDKDFSEARNFSVEKMVLASTHSCVFKDEGCKIEGPGEVLGDHIKTCQYRPFMCPGNGVRNNCPEPDAIKLSQAGDHFLMVHKSVKTDSKRILEVPFTSMVGDHSELTGDIAWPPRLIELDGKTFLGLTYTRNDIFYWASFCFGAAEEAGKYKAEMSFSSEKNIVKFGWTVPVQPIFKCEQLRVENEIDDVLIPFCHWNDLKKMAVRDDGISKYRFHTEFKISKC